MTVEVKSRQYPTRSAEPPRQRTLFDRLRNPSGSVTLTLGLDVVAAVTAVLMGEVWQHAVNARDESRASAWLFVPIVVSLLAAGGMYRWNLRHNFLDELRPTVSAVGLASFALLGIVLVLEDEHPGHQIVRIGVCAAVIMPLVRLARAKIQRDIRNHHRSASPTLLVGGGELINHLAHHMSALPEYGLRPVGILGASPPPADPTSPKPDPPVPYLGTPDDFARIAHDMGIEEVIIAHQGGASEDDLLALVRHAHRHRIQVWLVPLLHDAISDRAHLDHLGGVPLLVLPPVNPRAWQFAVKHTMDRIVSAFALVVISPVFLLLALLVRLSSPGPVFFRQRRVGRDGKPFDCLKFRSMRPPRESDAAFELRDGSAPGGVEGVDRRTWIGRIMRSTSLDELPQLINILRGEMSLVGPRPERPEFVELFEMQIKRYGERHRVKAGLTGWAQVHGLRGQTSIADRAEWDNYYIENFSVWLDYKILALTVLAVLKRAE